MSSTLAIVFTVVLGILLVVGLGALVLYKRFQRQAIPTATRPANPLSPQQELNSLGILEIKAKPRKSSHASESSDEAAPQRPAERRSEPPPVANRAMASQPVPTAGTETVEPVRRSTPPPSGIARKAGRADLLPMLQAIGASAGGYTVGLVRQERDHRYEILAMVSESEQAVMSGEIEIHPALLVEALQMAPVSIKDIGTEDITWEALGYYRQAAPVRQAAFVPVRVPDDIFSYLLVIDALAWRDLDDPWQRLLLGQFATLIGTYMASPLPADAAPKDGLRIRPRREIIAEEMDRARASGHSLALALVYLNRAEEMAGQGVKALHAAERALERGLKAITPTGRMERFGELTYGVFHEDNAAGVEAWALHTQEALAAVGELLAGGVSIGIALLQDRHTSPDEFRADATEALREAYETGACTIIE